MPDETPEPARGKEGDLDTPSRKAVRQHLNIIEQAVYGGWELPAQASKTIPDTLQGIMDDPNASVRDRIRASECLVALRRDRIEAAIQLDRILRLEAGTATDRVQIAVDLPDTALAAVAKSISEPTGAKRKRK